MQEGKVIEIRPWVMGEYSRVLVIPAWWLRVNGRPEVLEMEISVDSLIIRPKPSRDKVESGSDARA